MKHCGQSGLEYMVIVIIAVILVMPLVFMGNTQLSDARSSTNQMQAKQALNDIGAAVESVFAQGEPAKITLNVRFPDHINETSVGSNEIMVRIYAYGGTTDVVKKFDFNVTGFLPSDDGYYDITIMAVKITGVTWVNITSQ